MGIFAIAVDFFDHFVSLILFLRKIGRWYNRLVIHYRKSLSLRRIFDIMEISLGVHVIYVPFRCDCNTARWCSYMQCAPSNYICGIRALKAAWLNPPPSLTKGPPWAFLRGSQSLARKSWRRGGRVQLSALWYQAVKWRVVFWPYVEVSVRYALAVSSVIFAYVCLAMRYESERFLAFAVRFAVCHCYSSYSSSVVRT